jgi:DNA-binding transcriptional ArsR family regulator
MGNGTDASEARVLDALGDPTRRAVLELLRGGERSVRELTDATAVSQPAVSQHLRVLREAGLVTVRAEGTRRLHAVDLDGLAGLRAWVDGFWDDALAAFVEHADGEDRS